VAQRGELGVGETVSAQPPRGAAVLAVDAVEQVAEHGGPGPVGLRVDALDLAGVGVRRGGSSGSPLSGGPGRSSRTSGRWTVATPARARTDGPSAASSRAVRRSTTVPTSSTVTSASASVSVSRRSEPLRSRTPCRVLPPARHGSPPTSRRLSAPSIRSCQRVVPLTSITLGGPDELRMAVAPPTPMHPAARGIFTPEDGGVTAPQPKPQPQEPPTPQPGLVRRLGLGDAVVLGMGSMLGAGVFAAFGPAAAAAGSALLVALVVAGVVAWANGTSTARLAARHPESGGAYVYGRRRLGPAWGFLAGWGFVVGKTASCAAMALTIGAYAWPAQPRVVAAAAVVALTAVTCLGVTRTARVTRVLVVLTLTTLATVVVAALTGPHAGAPPDPALPDPAPPGPLGVLQAAGLLFFAFAGYARIATLGEEVRDPARTIPRAVTVALAVVLVVYAVVGAAALAAVGPAALAASAAPLATAAGGSGPVSLVVRVGGAVAAAGALLSLLAGVGRTTLAMARDRELPHGLAAVHPRYRVPHRATLAVGAVVLALVLLFDLRDAIGFSSFAVLAYYAVANACALTLGRRPLRSSAVAVVGLVGCVVLAATLPLADVVAGVAVLAAGLAGRALLGRRRRPGRAGARRDEGDG
jgi:APA family basic amino acid/polyamine antiporter